MDLDFATFTRVAPFHTQLCRQNGLRLSSFTALQYRPCLSNAALSGPLVGKQLKQSVKLLLEIDSC